MCAGRGASLARENGRLWFALRHGAGLDLRGLVARELAGHHLLVGGQKLLEVVQNVRVGGRDERGRAAVHAGAPGAADAVRVRLDLGGHLIVDHVRDALDVDAAAGHVGRHQDVELAVLVLAALRVARGGV